MKPNPDFEEYVHQHARLLDFPVTPDLDIPKRKGQLPMNISAIKPEPRFGLLRVRWAAAITLFVLVSLMLSVMNPLWQAPASQPVRSGWMTATPQVISEMTLEPISAQNFDQLQRLAVYGSGAINDVAWSPDGRQVAIADGRGVKLYDAAALVVPLQVFETETAVYHVVFSPDSQQLAGATPTEVNVWNLATAQQQLFTTGQAEPINELSFSYDGKLLAISYGRQIPISSVDFAKLDGGFQVWDLEDTTVPFWEDNSQVVLSLAFSPVSNHIVIGKRDDALHIWDIASQQPVVTLASGSQATSLMFNEDGTTIVGVVGKDVRLWDAVTGESAQFLASWRLDGESYIENAAFVPGSSQVVITGSSMGIWIWDTNRLPIREALTTLHEASIGTYQLALNPNGMQMLLAYDNSQLILWNLETLQQEQIIQSEQHFSPTAVALHPDGVRLALAGSDRIVRILDTHTGQVTAEQAFGDEVFWAWRMAFSPDGQWLAIAGQTQPDDYYKNIVWLWDLGEHTMQVPPPDQQTEVSMTPFAFVTDAEQASQIAIVSKNVVQLYGLDTQQGTTLLSDLGFSVRNTGLSDMTFIRGAEQLISVPWQGYAYLWDIATGETLAHFELLQGGSVARVHVSPDENLLALSTVYGVIVSNLTNYETLYTLAFDDPYILGLAFTPYSQALVVLRNEMLAIYDASTGELLSGAELAQSFSTYLLMRQDSKLLITTGTHGLVEVWGVLGQ